jgi:hypothetical protein
MQTESALNGKEINLTGDNTIIKSTNFNVDKDGNMTCKNANVKGTITSSDATITGGTIRVQGDKSSQDILRVENNNNNSIFSYMQPIGAGYVNGNSSQAIYIMAGDYMSSIEVQHGGSSSEITHNQITTPTLIQTSLVEHKKNFKKMQDNALEIIKNIDIYKYNLKNEKDTDKKHIGFVIGENYKYSKEITSKNNDGVDTYSFVSVCCKAIQEQQAQIEELKKEIEMLKGEKND